MSNIKTPIKMYKATEDLVKIYKESLHVFSKLQPSIDKRLRGNNLADQFEKEIKKISDSILTAKLISRKLISLFPTTDSNVLMEPELITNIINVLDSAFQNLDDWYGKWKSELSQFKVNSDWFGPFTEDQSESILKLRYLGHSIEDIADMLNITNKAELELMINKWMIEKR
jgi:hypothetical protein